MRTRVKNTKKGVFEQHIATGECHHYWLIESAKGRTSTGVCKLCGARKDFFNSIPEWDSTVVKKHVPFQELPELDVGSDSKQSNS